MRLNEIAEIDTIAAIVPCVKAGLGAAIVPDIAIRDPGSENLVTAAFGEPQVHRQMGLVERVKNPSAAIIADLHQTLAALSGVYGVQRIDPDTGGQPARSQRARATGRSREQQLTPRA